MTSSFKYPHLGRFLADHFGGYPSASAAATQESGGDVDAYIEGFIEGVPEKELLEANAWLGLHEDFESMRRDYFDDDGNVLKGALPVPVGLLKIIQNWN